ncbi:MAG: hypothetical protein LBU51_02540 [Bacteroidales bacterium]|jgi:gliding motility-associated lipoprotein GldD|nr:hypothetical protein [Bacteroidales bacterium]
MKKLFFCLLVPILVACGNHDFDYSPKPKGYFRIDLPEHSYTQWDSLLPFTFDYSKAAVCKVEAKKEHVFWIDITYPAYNAVFNIACIPLKNNLRDLAVNEEKMVNFHIESGKADDVQLSYIEDPEAHVYGRIYDITGKEAATTLQFWISDSVKYYVRGALFFQFAPNNDSLQPVINYLKEDALQLVNSLKWK